jgi:regulator of protease activity HflC (stomatin/prohibitin superfamily)
MRARPGALRRRPLAAIRDLSPWEIPPLWGQYRNRSFWVFDKEVDMSAGAVVSAITVAVVVVAFLLGSAVRVIKQYERGVHFRLGRVIAVREPGLRLIIPLIDRLWRVSLRIVTQPIQSQGIITRDNVSVDIAAVAYFRVVDARKSVVAIEKVTAAIDQIAQTTLRNVVGQHFLDEVLADTSVINGSIREILDTTTLEWGVEVTLVELKDIQLPDSMKRAMAREAEAEREKRAKIIAAEGEARAAAALGDASDTMMRHPLALQLRNLQTLAELGVETNTTVVFPAPMMSAIGELAAFLARESTAATAESASEGQTASVKTPVMTARIGASRENAAADR